EDLFFDRAEEVQEELSRIVRERHAGESALDALARAIQQVLKGTGPLFGSKNLKPFVATIDASPALRLRERLLLDRSEQRLAHRLQTETGAKPDDSMAPTVATLVIGVVRRLVEEFRIRLLRGDSDQAVRAALLRIADRGFGLLRSGIGDYARRGKR